MNNLYGSFLKALYTMFEARNSRLDVFFFVFFSCAGLWAECHAMVYVSMYVCAFLGLA